MNTIKASIAFTAVCVLAWLAIGFVAWDWNPENWEPMGRISFVLIATMFGGLAAAVKSGAMT